MVMSQPWPALLAAPHPCDHVVQLYTDDGFLGRAVSHFIGTGLARGEAAVVVATPEHCQDLVETLGTRLDVEETLARGQLVIRDARTALDRFLRPAGPDPVAFRTFVSEVLDPIEAAGRTPIRIFGEMVNLLWREDLPATVRLEALWSEVLMERQVTLLCAYQIDNFDRHVHRGLLHQISRSHSHLVPVEDYTRLEEAVDRAYTDVFGAGPDTAKLRELMAVYPMTTTRMPAPQAALVALRELRGDIADAVLERARDYYLTGR
jgi:KaiC/GvpD/RAD55 family RecA-like ATPase